MNERIKELSLQAGWLDDKQFASWNKLHQWQNFDKEKFAELIVAKCVNQCEFVAGQAEIANTGEMARKTKATANNCAFWIKEYFGVEE